MVNFRFNKRPPTASYHQTYYYYSDNNNSRPKDGFITAAIKFVFVQLFGTSSSPRQPQQQQQQQQQPAATAPASTANKKSNNTTRINNQSFECIICFDLAPINLCFVPNYCDHRICRMCATTYVHQISEPSHHQTSYDKLNCPGFQCKETLVTNQVLSIIYFNDQEIISSWWSAVLKKSCIKNKITCPQVNCGAVFDVNPKFLRKCTFSECYECHKGFCIACQDKWHPGVIKIVDDQKELAQTLLHADNNNWSRCPTCFHIIERTQGCLHIRCRCGENFCYRCGGKMYEHNVCANNCNKYSDKKLTSIRRKMFDGNRKDVAPVIGVV